MRNNLNVTHTKLKVTEINTEHKNCKNLVSHSAYSHIQQGEEMTTLAEILQRDSLYIKSTLSLQERAYNMRQQKSNKGFTLIELLIVIAIIGILAAVLIPNLLSARQRAYDTASQSFLRELATTAESYYIDENTYPNSYTDLTAAPYNLKVPANVVPADVTNGTSADYCFAATHTGSPNGEFSISPGTGIVPNLTCTP